MLHRRAIGAYLALLFGTLLFAATLLAALAPFLPYGAYASYGFAFLIALALIPGLGFVRMYALGRCLTTGELLRMDANEIPRLDGHTYLGNAFPWKPAHAERLYHLMSRGVEAPEEVQAALGGNTLIHGLGIAGERPLFIPDQKRTHHALILGSPGEGKTRAIELMVRQLIEKGDVVVIVDPKGDARLMNVVRQVCLESGRADQFRLVALPWIRASAAYNPLSHFGTPHEVAQRLISLFPPAGGESEAFRGFQEAATKAVVQGLYLASVPITIRTVLDGLRELSPVTLEFIKKRHPEIAADDVAQVASKYEAAVAQGSMPRSRELEDLLYYLRKNPDYYDRMTASFLPQLERLIAGPKEEIIAPDPRTTPREILTWPGIDRRKLVVYFYLANLKEPTAANSIGKLLLLDLQSYLAARYSYAKPDERNLVSLFVDEAHHLVSEAFLHVLAEGRGAHVACVLSTQTTAQFEQAMGSRAAIDEILTQNWAYIQFQTRNPREAEDFAKLAGERQMRLVGESHRYEPAFFSSGLANVDDFRATFTQSIQYRDAYLVPPWAIAQLPTFHYFARLGGRTLKGRIPLLSDPVSTFSEDLKREAAL